MTHETDLSRFERLALPHLDAAWNLARWLTRDEQDAQDVVQEAMLRALRYFAAFRGENARPWLLAIVRNTCMGWLRDNRPALLSPLDDEEDEGAQLPAPERDEPHVAAALRDERAQVNRALASLPVHYREVLVLRELEDLSYRDIATIAQVPVGTVMSRLARARDQLRAALRTEARPGLRAVPRAANEEGRR
ncbi:MULTISPECIES: sigma-70 family RNA polymerase sigma factor [Ramlibacter]|uniref:RNA polymerase sigma factor n=1 Tax=Ramlibacter pinisoli TaxID=2682844 RepID=A0A6N8IYN6_9BURK|nr:sigma-70 family RNA polymerase sigma factor [Ramlibacter sp. CGMCC 1.13660]MVQ32094.1 sigma-70 family RNA polymerase sigma factor [Ramlibacter pinisoli]